MLLNISFHYDFYPLLVVAAIAWTTPILLSLLKLKKIPIVIIEIILGFLAGKFLFGLGFSTNDAVRMGVFLHGFAGDLAAKDKGEDGLIASDIMNQLPASLKIYREKFDSIIEDHYHSIYII